jgi:hypothetical protein
MSDYGHLLGPPKKRRGLFLPSTSLETAVNRGDLPHGCDELPSPAQALQENWIRRE